jgi:hypothetical protein
MDFGRGPPEPESKQAPRKSWHALKARAVDRAEATLLVSKANQRHAKASKEEEDLCDLGAAALTMPENRFRSYIVRRPLGLSLIDDCSTEFAVSFIAAGRRTVALADESACLFIAEMCLTNQERRSGAGKLVLRVTHLVAVPVMAGSRRLLPQAGPQRLRHERSLRAPGRAGPPEFPRYRVLRWSVRA